ncbi:MAG: ATP-binding cassette domain-containing protein [Deltaproteobacteria bacterium]|nr:ATP-binding cassette domain-containing protein [Deltaproteobacteria bacterium]
MTSFSAHGLARSVGGRVLFEGLSLQLDTGETLVVRGPSGSGKTLLLRGLAGLDPIGAGTMTLDGAAPEQLGWGRWRRRVLFVAQDPPVHPGTPHDWVERVRHLKAQTSDLPTNPVMLAAQWGLAAPTWEQPWTELSGGERQRAALALALASDPAVLLLDEPTSALDPEATSAVEESLRGRAVIWVTHDSAQAARVGTRTLELRARP